MATYYTNDVPLQDLDAPLMMSSSGATASEFDAADEDNFTESLIQKYASGYNEEEDVDQIHVCEQHTQC
jgi:hypothetical protein